MCSQIWLWNLLLLLLPLFHALVTLFGKVVLAGREIELTEESEHTKANCTKLCCMIVLGAHDLSVSFFFTHSLPSLFLIIFLHFSISISDMLPLVFYFILPILWDDHSIDPDWLFGIAASGFCLFRWFSEINQIYIGFIMCPGVLCFY